MAFTPFTLEEAAEIAEDFEDLNDTDFKIGTSPVMLVLAVVVSPFAEDDKAGFAARYFESRNCDNAMSSYTGDDYDVILLTGETDNDPDYSIIGIREFAELRGIKYEFPVRE